MNIEHYKAAAERTDADERALIPAIKRNKAQHSPLPWSERGDERGKGCTVFDASRQVVARCDKQQGELIVASVNHADKLAEALRKSADTFNDLAKALRLLKHGTMAHACDIAEQSTREALPDWRKAAQ